MNLAAEMAKLPEPKTDKKPPLWEFWRWQLWQLAQTDDPHNFHKWPPVYHTMLQDHWPDAIAKEFEHIRVHNSGVATVFYGERNFSEYLNLIHQAYHILRWQEATGQRIADMRSVYEFGGGYGAMALVCNRLGFRGQYYIYDLPEFALLQQWYLSECRVDNVTWEGIDAWRGVDLFIACYSLSETDYAERDRIFSTKEASSYLFLYSNKFEQYDNIEYFQGLDDKLDVDRWAHAKIEHLPPESWYTWGW